MRGIHRHQERVLPFHIGEMVHEFRQTATTDLKTPLLKIYDRLTKKFVCRYFFSYCIIFLDFSDHQSSEQPWTSQSFNS